MEQSKAFFNSFDCIKIRDLITLQQIKIILAIALRRLLKNTNAKKSHS